MEEYFLSLKKFKQNSDLIDIENIYYTIKEKNDSLIENNKNLLNKIIELENIIKEKELQIKNKDEEIASYRKSSILSAMSKQVEDLKGYVNILEKQIKNYKIKNDQSQDLIKEKEDEILEVPIQETIIDENKDVIIEKEEKEEEKEEYEKIEYKGKLYYKIKKRIYKINKDKSVGVLFARLKNGEIIKED
jgi:hypothetical protein